jgi:hypothetical protein
VTSPALAREMPDGSRAYTHPLTGEEVPSVTTVIAMMNKPKLVGWSARMAAEYAVSHWEELGRLPVMERVSRIRYAHERVRDEKADLGDAVHNLIDAWQKGKPSPDPPGSINAYVSQFIAFMTEKRPRFLMNEFTVWSDVHGYAGTGDWIAEIAGRIVLGDTKSGRRVYEEAGLQVSALAGADHILTPEGAEIEMPAIDALAVLHIRPRSWKLIPVSRQEENFRAFLACRQIWEWNHHVKPYVLGAA